MRIGVDLVKNERVKKWDKSTLLDTLFSSAEKDLILSVQGTRRIEIIAGRFAVKEAVLKAFQLGVKNGIELNEIETLMAENGSPVLVLRGKAKEYLHSMGIQGYAVSISHDAGMTTAVVVLA